MRSYSFLTTVPLQQWRSSVLEKGPQWAVLMDVKESLEGIGKQKLEQSLPKNTDVQDVATNKNLNYRLHSKYAPLVSVDVEHSFSSIYLATVDAASLKKPLKC